MQCIFKEETKRTEINFLPCSQLSTLKIEMCRKKIFLYKKYHFILIVFLSLFVSSLTIHSIYIFKNLKREDK